MTYLVKLHNIFPSFVMNTYQTDIHLVRTRGSRTEKL